MNLITNSACKVFSLFGPFLVLSLATLVLSQEYLIVPNSQSSCHTNATCFTLDQLAQISLTNGANLTLIFQPGEHTLTQLFSIHNFTHVQMTGQNTSVLTLYNSGWIEISNIDQLSIDGLTFTAGHTRNDTSTALAWRLSVSSVHSFLIKSSSFAGLYIDNIHHVYQALIYLAGTSNVVIEDLMFDTNNGTQLWISKAVNVSIKSSTFSGNQGGLGELVFIESIIHNGTVSIKKCTFTGNQGESSGAVYIQNSVHAVSIEKSTFTGNQGRLGGAVGIHSVHTVLIENNTFTGNQGTHSGAAYIESAHVLSIDNSKFIRNEGRLGGAVGIHSVYTVSLEISTFTGSCTFTNNNATGQQGKGGAINVAYIGALHAKLSISHSVLEQNRADFHGGGIWMGPYCTSIRDSSLTGNRATSGGGIYADSGKVSIKKSVLQKNSASKDGGGIFMTSGSVSIHKSTLTDNSAGLGNIIHPTSTLLVVKGTIVENNTAETNSMYIAQSTLTFMRKNTIRNSRSIYLLNSRVHFNGPTEMDNNYGKYGGAIEAVQSTVYFNSTLTISNNTAAEYGGGIFLRESILFVILNSLATMCISHNTANEGGAIYAYQSTIEFNDTGYGNVLSLTNNVANNNGGGIYATSSIIKISKSFVNVDSNTAVANGGGFYLQQNSKLYIQKQLFDYSNDSLGVNLTVSNNKAVLGGGMYVNDSTSGGGACNSASDVDFLGECFIQTLKLYYGRYADIVQYTSNTVNTFITNNTANQSGDAIYGGLLDRCTASPSAELLIFFNVLNGLEYIRRTVQLPKNEHSISSDPLQVKLCNCSSGLNISARKGQPFQLCIKALDQAGNTVNATIHGAVVTKSEVGRLKEGQVEQRVGRECTELEYNVFSEDSSAEVELYGIGPCTNQGLSRLLLTVTFLNCTCPLGFKPSQSNIECRCECDQELQATKCFPEQETFQPGNSLWVGAKNFTNCNDTGYLIQECPFDYCVDLPVNVSLNSSQQIDRQCAYNRSGVLCGECGEELSLVFASSKCEKCSDTYLLLLIPFTAAGIVLVVFILWLNITIATGTIYGLIIYANILAANKSIFLPFKAPNFLTVFVSWVNLDLGIETCFYNGMNSQAKVLLQLAFPVYLFVLMFLIIVLSAYVNSFAKLLSNRNPVAALCTLLILSYSKLLRLIIAALQFTSLDCSDNSIVWLYDGNVEYFSLSHVPRFIVAAVILTACVLFTTLLFFGQWFPRCSKWKVIKWTKNTKYIGFMDAFHAPFTPKHRYWPGLLLFVLIAHNLTASIAPDTSVPVLSAGCIAGGLNVYKFLMNRVYKNRIKSALETLFLLNVTILALGMATIKTNTGQIALSYVSMAIAFIIFVVTTCYHFYKYVLKKTDVWNNQVRPLNPARRINFNINRHRNYQRVAEDDDDVELPAVMDMYTYGPGPREETDPDKYITPPIITPASRLDQLREPDLDILAPITEDDYRQATPIPQAKNRLRPVVTSTVVNIVKD